MALTTEKTWTHIQAIAEESAVDPTNIKLLFDIKTGLVTGSGAWTVAGSSDAVAAGMDSVDRWIDTGDIVFSTGNHSWIVFEQAGIGSGLQLLFDCDYSSTATEYLNVSVSYTGAFTGGTISAPPTATDERSLLAGLWLSGTNGRFSSYVLKTTDGACTRVVLLRNGVHYRNIFIETPKTPESYWTEAWFGEVATDIPSVLRYHTNSNIKAYISATLVDLIALCQGRISDASFVAMTQFQVPDRSGGWTINPVVWAIDNVSIRGLCGVPYDLWMGPQSLPFGEYLRGAGAPFDYMILPPFIFPWDGNPLYF